MSDGPNDMARLDKAEALPTGADMLAQAARNEKIPAILARAKHYEALALAFLQGGEALAVQAATTFGGPVAGLGAQLARAQLDAVIGRGKA